VKDLWMDHLQISLLQNGHRIVKGRFLVADIINGIPANVPGTQGTSVRKISN